MPIDDEAGSSGALASAERSLLVRPVAPRSVPSLTSRVAPVRFINLNNILCFQSVSLVSLLVFLLTNAPVHFQGQSQRDGGD